MIAPVILLGELPLAVHRATKFTSPQDQRVLQHATLLQVSDQRGLRTVNRVTLLPQFTGKVVVLIPSAHVQLDETNITFSKPARHEAVCRKASGLTHIRSIHLKRCFALVTEVREFRHRHLHAVRHLMLRNASARLGIQ